MNAEPATNDLPRPFGRFVLLREIGRGAMGVVYEARQEDLGRRVALKLVLGGRFAAREGVARFLAEARAAAGLDHPHLVRVFEAGEFEGQHYFTMELVEGRSLAEAISESKLPPAAAARLIAEAADAIQYAHERGVLHRDLKPRNVLIDAAGRPRITDFGLAKRVDEDASLTGSGDAVGTPAYMAPEQASGDAKQVGPAADVYGLGAVLYAAISGRPLFLSPTALGTLRLVQERDPIPLRVLEPEVPRDLETICHACLHKLPSRRYASAGALADDLRRFLAGEPVRARPVGATERAWLRARKHPALSASLAALALVVAGAFALVTRQWRIEREALGELEAAQRASRDSRLTTLALAKPDAVQAILRELDPRDPEVERALRARIDSPRTSAVARLRARLALLPIDASLLGDLPASLAPLRDESEEIALAVSVLRELRPSLDRDAWAGFAASLAASARGARGGDVFAALLDCALEPKSGAWLDARAELARWLARLDPYVLPVWERTLAPFPRPLLDALADELHGEPSAQAALQAARLLARRGADEPELLANALPRTSDEAFGILLPALRGADERALEALRAELDARLSARWSDPPLGPPADAASVRAVEAAAGLVAERFALAPRIGIDDFLAVSDALRGAGYRPVRARPRLVGDELEVAAVWARDGLDWALGFDLGEDELRAWCDALEARRLEPVDLASWKLDGTSDERFLALAAAERGDARRAATYLGHLDEERALDRALVTARKLFGDDGFRPDAFSLACDGAGEVRACTVWRPCGRSLDFFFVPTIEPEVYARDPFPRLCQSDVACWRESSERGGALRFAGSWFPDPRFESRSLVCASADEHRSRCAELAAMGFRPRSLAAAEDARGATECVASVWQRPVPAPDLRRASERARSRAALALVELGGGDAVYPRLAAESERELRARFAVGAAELGLDPERLFARLERTDSLAERRALVLALGGYEPSALAAGLRERASVRLASLYLDPDPGLHSAARWALARWELPLPRIDSPPAGARWRFEPGGIEMIEVAGPVEFLMGSPGTEPGREPNETPHRRLVPRRFALSACELTEGDLERFFDAVPAMRPRFPTPPDVPSTSISFFQAVGFCRWLSEELGVPEEEMCYPPFEEIGPGMRIDPALLDRTGFRLPTEAEWECACRAGSEASYSFGEDPELLPFFAHCRANSLEDAGPVARFRPNDFGFFDLHGNVAEWCVAPLADYQVRTDARATDEAFRPALLRDESSIAVRGGNYDLPASALRSAARTWYAAGSYPRGQGFRIARTLR